MVSYLVDFYKDDPLLVLQKERFGYLTTFLGDHPCDHFFLYQKEESYLEVFPNMSYTIIYKRQSMYLKLKFQRMTKVHIHANTISNNRRQKRMGSEIRTTVEVYLLIQLDTQR